MYHPSHPDPELLVNCSAATATTSATAVGWLLYTAMIGHAATTRAKVTAKPIVMIGLLVGYPVEDTWSLTEPILGWWRCWWERVVVIIPRMGHPGHVSPPEFSPALPISLLPLLLKLKTLFWRLVQLCETVLLKGFKRCRFGFCQSVHGKPPSPRVDGGAECRSLQRQVGPVVQRGTNWTPPRPPNDLMM
ncbi:hypothetical protein QBC44DRAFT_355734 [Cladorrhinum sp. PSN332]|nr:hypothetical protein QBC44DRAFT_355734 [Cladorrhinum sp. PSN332]